MISESPIHPTLRRFWPVAAVGLLAGILAFAGSFAVSPTYESATRLLIRGRDTTFLTSTGTPLTQQPGVVDVGLATALGETQSALLSTRKIAEQVVDELGLDDERPAEERSLGTRAKDALTSGYKHVRAWLTSGFYAEPAPRDAAVQAVYLGLAAEQVDDSYVLELRARWDDPKLAATIADTAADSLVALSLERFRSESLAYREHLAAQVDRAEAAAAETREEVRAYKAERGITNLDLQVQLTTSEADRLTGQARDLAVQHEGARAELASIRSSLSGTTTNASSSSRISTGRSTTEIEQTGSNTAYQSLLAEEARAEASVASLSAQIARLESELTGADAESLAGDEAELSALDQRYAAATTAYAQVTEDYQNALLSVGLDPVDVSRVDSAGVPTYPIAPVRYLYLAMGALAGAALGLAIAARNARRRGERLLPDLGQDRQPLDREPPTSDVTDEPLVIPDLTPRRQPVPAGAMPSTMAAAGAAPTGNVAHPRATRVGPATGRGGSGRFEVFQQAAAPAQMPTDVSSGFGSTITGSIAAARPADVGDAARPVIRLDEPQSATSGGRFDVFENAAAEVATPPSQPPPTASTITEAIGAAPPDTNGTEPADMAVTDGTTTSSNPVTGTGPVSRGRGFGFIPGSDPQPTAPTLEAIVTSSTISGAIAAASKTPSWRGPRPGAVGGGWTTGEHQTSSAGFKVPQPPEHEPQDRPD